MHVKIIKPQFDAIPTELHDQPWLVWRARPRESQPGKLDKVPHSPKTNHKTSPTNLDSYGSLIDARNAYENGNYDGIGIGLFGEGLVGIDIDNHRKVLNERPEVKRWVGKVVKRNGYVEYSPSGKGLRIFLKGRLPGRGRKCEGLEAYDTGRFLTVTGYKVSVAGRLNEESLIPQAQELIDEFLSFLGAVATNEERSTFQTDRVGRIARDEVPVSIREKIPGLFMNADSIIPNKFRSLYEGNLDTQGGDHSAADLAFIGLAHRNGLSATEADILLRSSGLYREKWDQKRGARTYGELTISKVYANHEENEAQIPQNQIERGLKHPDAYIPIYHPLGMPARPFAGPLISPGVRLFPLNALSTMVGFGGTGKTTAALSIGVHIAAGKSWGGTPLSSRKVIFASVEESQDELNRKFSAATDNWTDEERDKALNNLRMISLHGIDARLTTAQGRRIDSSGWGDLLVKFCSEFELVDGVIFLDHLQGLTSGDLNSSDTVTAICREANRIASSTGSAVVFLSHTSKGHLKTGSTELNQGFASGSLAFENAMRQTIGLVTLTEEEAKGFGIYEERKRYVWLGLPKNSYGEVDSGVWLKKTPNARFHTVTIEPVNLQKAVKTAIKTATERVVDDLVTYLRVNPWTTRNAIENLAGTKSRFKASTKALRNAISMGIESGQLELYTVTATERSTHGLPKQVKEVLRATS